MPRIGNAYRIDEASAYPTRNMHEAKWLELRRKGVGGSDIGPIMGLSPYKSAFEVWADKRGLTKPIATNEHIEFGNRMEPVLRKWLQDELQTREEDPALRVLSSPYLYASTINPRYLANVDGVVVNEEGEAVAGAEIKTASDWQAKWWEGEDIPDAYYAQVQWYMGVTGLLFWYLAALVGKRFLVKTVPINPAFIERQKEAADDFLAMVDSGIPPAPTGTDGDFDILMGMYPQGTEDIIDAPELASDLTEYKRLQAAEKEAGEAVEELKAKLELRMGEAKILTAGAMRASWSRYDVTRIDSTILKTEHPEVYEAVKKTTRQGRFTVSENKKGGKA